MTKSQLRSEMRRRLAGGAGERAVKSNSIVAAILAHPSFVNAGSVALFSALPTEPELAGLWQHRGTRRFCFPRVEAARLLFFEVSASEELEAAAWHPLVREPRLDPLRVVAPADLDLILVPGLAFTRSGNRLGRGGGFYDRLLADLPARTRSLGVGFAAQLLAELPLEAHDQRVEAVITESAAMESPAALGD